MIRRSPSGHRCGESHQNAKLPDETVIAMRAEHIPGVYGKGMRALARKYGCGLSTARDILTYATRML